MPGFGDRLTCVSENFYEKERNTHTRTQKNPRRKIAHSKDEKVGLKSQSAMEYLMTYGWAILIIAIVLVAFFSLNLFNPYTFAPKASPGSCQILRPNGPGSNIFVSAVGPTCTTNEIPQYVAQFNAADSHINAGNAADLNINGQITISTWVNLQTWINYPTFVSKGYSTTGGYSLSIRSDGRLWFELDQSNGTREIYDPTNIKTTTGIWYNVVATYNGSVQRIYINGQQDGTGNAAAFTIGTVSNSLDIGVGVDGGYGQFLGSISNVQIYNTSLSTSAINTLYAEGIGGAPVDIQNLVGWWPLNGNSNDYSGNGNNGVPTSVTFTSSWENGYSTP